MAVFTLSNRSVLRIAGPDAAHFLHNLVTTDIEGLAANEIRPGALLTPQGKILFDFLVSREDDSFRLECRSDIAAEFAKRLRFYRLRAKVEIALEEQVLVAVRFGPDSSASEIDSSGTWLTDRRFAADAKVYRSYGTDSSIADENHAYDRLRLENGVAEGGLDYAFSDAFPHDVNLDQIHGVSFSKGCYVGQEVVSRMQHRGTARRRILLASGDGPLISGATVMASGKTIGALGTALEQHALALVRIDKVKSATSAGAQVRAGRMPVTFKLPPGVNFDWPSEAGQAE